MLWKGERVSRRDLAFIAVLSALAVAALLAPQGWHRGADSRALAPAVENTVRARGTVLEVDDSGVRQFGVVRVGDQGVVARVKGGRYRDEVVTANNMLLGKLELDKVFAPGDQILLTLRYKPETGGIVDAVAVDHYRIHIEIYLFVAFAILIILFAGWTGAKALFSFLFAVVLIWKVLLPAFLIGWNPVPVAFGIVTCLAFATVFLIGGLNLRGLIAFLGAMTGVGMTTLCAVLLSQAMRIHGAVQPFSETLLYSGYGHLNLTAIFTAGVFLASSGAVMDLAVDVAASMAEVKAKRPDISLRALVGSGMTVGRAMLGTMITTLLLAYSGGYSTLLMVFMAQGTPAVNIANMTYVAAEILQTLVGSFGLVLTAPATALIGGVLLSRFGPSRDAASGGCVRRAPRPD